jgi:hypothetical protein
MTPEENLRLEDRIAQYLAEDGYEEIKILHWTTKVVRGTILVKFDSLGNAEKVEEIDLMEFIDFILR